MQRLRVPLSFACAALFLLVARPRPVTLLAGATISVFGLLLRAWASGHIRKNSFLATSGPYAHTRNPLYFGNFLLGLGFTIGSGRWPLGILFAGLFLGIYLPVMRVESETLGQLFGESYQRYTRGVPLFFPRVLPYRSGEGQTEFDRSLYIRYREYRAALGFVVAWGLLVFEAYYLK